MNKLLLSKAQGALRQANNDWAAASRHLVEEATKDPALLLALTEKYLRGAAGQVIQHVARRTQQAPAASQSIPPSTGGPMFNPVQGGRPDDIWDQIIGGLQSEEAMNPEQHEKALRTMAKAFMAKRLEDYEDAKGMGPIPPRKS